MMMIVNCMPAVPLGAAALTAPRHHDISGLSVLLVVDGCQGFQVFKDGQWWSVPWMNRHALVVNSGDLMQVISNGRYKSLVHRAINLGDTMRISIASVYNPKKFAKIGPIAELIDEDHPCLYGEGRHVDFLEAVRAKPMTCFQYFGSLNC
ncbi:hypothetical protein HHK36_017699 [Tetracentron sinense]|uniref:Fe2OG dioxygenase domain-containing protein n=1 Tax=Tetracentron sinense TaxID=13715 RepID=A0A834YXK8_TETSI|nr:hypothetical protein HHK36_017699 [Tetracentron sinense]